jgi:hypothetical protein
MKSINEARWIHAFLFFIIFPIGALAIPPGDNDAPSYFAIEGPELNADALDPMPTAPTQAPRFAPSSSALNPAPFTGREKFHFYLRSTFGPIPVLASLGGSGIRQAWDSVPEWGQGMEGYGKRVASSLAQKAVKRSIHLGIASLLHEDPRYVASGRSGIWRRTLYAVGKTFVSQKISGGTRFAYSRFAGAYGAAIISRQWYPKDDRTAGDIFSAGVISISLDVAGNVFEEFWPSLKKLLPR